MRFKKTIIFFGSVIIGIAASYSAAYINFHASQAPTEHALNIRHLTDSVYVSEQITTGDIDKIKAQAFSVLVDLRPDGEAPDQQPSGEIEKAAKKQGIDFYYVPIPHEHIPSDAVTKLQQLVTQKDKNVLLYCRSGNRAARTFALAQASNPHGPDASTIMEMVIKAGHSAEDLRGEIERRISMRENQNAQSQ